MRVCGVIPARLGSTRLYAKPLISISGKAMIQHVYERVQKSKLIDFLVVATDSESIISAVKSFNGNAEMTSESCNNGTERVFEISQRYPDYDFYVNIQGDEPLIRHDIIDQTIKGLIDNKSKDIATIATTSNSKEDYNNPNRVKVVKSLENEALYFSRSSIPFFKDSHESFLLHIGLYVYTKKFISNLIHLKESKLESYENLEQLKFMDNGYRIHLEETDYKSIGVDTIEDVSIIENLIKEEIE